MFKVNRQTDYAVRVVLALAKREPDTRLSSALIQREMMIPVAFMSRIVARLAAAGLVRTFPGRDGGLQLPRPAQEITLRDVLEAFEGPILLSECMHSLSTSPFSPKQMPCSSETEGSENGENERGVDCPFRSDCPVRSKWGRVQAALLRELASISFAELAEEARSTVPLETVIPVSV